MKIFMVRYMETSFVFTDKMTGIYLIKYNIIDILYAKLFQNKFLLNQENTSWFALGRNFIRYIDQMSDIKK